MGLILVGAVAAIGLALAVASLTGVRRARREFEREKQELLARAAPAPAAAVLEAALPDPVRRYLEVSGAPALPPFRSASVRQRGEIRMTPDGAWIPFEAEQVYTREPPAFLWLARARLAPTLAMMARDRFVDGRGHMLVRLLGHLPVADARGPGMDQGAALRLWGEMLAFPEAALDPRVRWEPLEARRARMIVEHDGVRIAADVRFGADGFPAEFTAERYRDADGGVLTPWSGHLRDWRRFGARPFPARWTSVWHLPEGDFEAVRMEVLDLRTR